MTQPIQIKNVTLGSGIPKICVPLTGTKKEEICRQAEAAVAAEADLTEWRADFFENLENQKEVSSVLDDLSEILGQIPLLFTIRTAAEGGQFNGTIDTYAKICLYAAKTGKTDLIDVEVFGEEERKKDLVAALQKEGVSVIASSHDFQKTDSQDQLLKRFQDMEQTGADILKIAVMPEEQEDVVSIMRATKEMSLRTTKPLISMSMGQLGSISRLSGENFGSCVTFGTVGQASAPGQFPIRELRVMMKALHEKNETENK